MSTPHVAATAALMLSQCAPRSCRLKPPAGFPCIAQQRLVQTCIDGRCHQVAAKHMTLFSFVFQSWQVVSASVSFSVACNMSPEPF